MWACAGMPVRLPYDRSQHTFSEPVVRSKVMAAPPNPSGSFVAVAATLFGTSLAPSRRATNGV